MGLEKEEHPGTAGVPGRTDHGGNLGRMMPVVVHEQVVVGGVYHLEAPFLPEPGAYAGKGGHAH